MQGSGRCRVDSAEATGQVRCTCSVETSRWHPTILGSTENRCTPTIYTPRVGASPSQPIQPDIGCIAVARTGGKWRARRPKRRTMATGDGSAPPRSGGAWPIRRRGWSGDPRRGTSRPAACRTARRADDPRAHPRPRRLTQVFGALLHRGSQGSRRRSESASVMCRCGAMRRDSPRTAAKQLTAASPGRMVERTDAGRCTPSMCGPR
jgi:hypothetical protein